MKKNYFLIGLSLYLGMKTGKTICEVAQVLNRKLVSSDWYAKTTGKIKKNSDEKTEEPQMKIGFDVT